MGLKRFHGQFDYRGRVYATGEHDITSGSHTKEVNTSGGVLVINNYLYYATP